MTPIRTPAVAGSWYPGTASALTKAIDGHLAATASRSGRRSGRARGAARGTDVLGAGGGARVSAARGPHVRRRGARRSVAFRRLRRRVDRVVRWLRDASGRVADRGGLRASRFASLAGRFASIRPRMLREHSLEMQLPFIQRLAPGAADRAAGHGVSNRRRRRSRSATRSPRRSTGAERCSSPAPICRITTTRPPRNSSIRVVIDCVSQLDADRLQRALDDQPGHACGGGPTVAVMRAARQLGARDAVVLDYADSGDVSGDKSSVVGYLAAAIGRF